MFGPVLVRVSAINPEVVKTFEQVAGEIRHDLALNEAHRVLLDVHDAYEDARAGGETLAEAAERLKLKVTRVDAVDRSGQRPDGSVVNDLPASAALLKAAFETETGVENDAVNIGNDGYVFFEVEGITPARDRTLDEVKDKVTADWITAETARKLTEKATELDKRLKDGTGLDAIAAELGLETQTKRGLKREADDADLGRDGVAAIFATVEGGTGSFPAPTGEATVLFKVTEVFEPAASGPDAVAERDRKAFASGLADDLLDQLVAQLQSQYGVSVDQAAIARALSF
jgi:peptidyl-prolyl cis-trans isomerase D